MRPFGGLGFGDLGIWVIGFGAGAGLAETESAIPKSQIPKSLNPQIPDTSRQASRRIANHLLPLRLAEKLLGIVRGTGAGRPVGRGARRYKRWLASGTQTTSPVPCKTNSGSRISAARRSTVCLALNIAAAVPSGNGRETPADRCGRRAPPPDRGTCGGTQPHQPPWGEAARPRGPGRSRRTRRPNHRRHCSRSAPPVAVPRGRKKRGDRAAHAVSEEEEPGRPAASATARATTTSRSSK